VGGEVDRGGRDGNEKGGFIKGLEDKLHVKD
jgi:hypothetical protein